MPVLLNTAYFPPISFFALAAREFTLSADRVIPSIVYLEACENYQKQSYRNRCMIYSASGPEALSFPIIHKDGTHNNIPIKEVLIDYSVPWIQRHERTMISAYRTSAYFEYYSDGIFAILESRHETLYTLNKALIEFFLAKTGLKAELRDTEDFIGQGSGLYGEDWRERIHPKRPDSILKDLKLDKPYFQVFAEKHGFIPNLSIMDLLFNEGPESISYLKNAE